jgi:hypothetical protein
MRLSRREIVWGAAGAALSVPAPGQTPAAAVDPAVADFAKAARDAMQRNSEALAKTDIPVSTEPAFQFKA